MSDKAFDQRDHVVHGPQTNIAGGVQGPVLSGQFNAPVLIEFVRGIDGISTDYANRIKNFLIEYLGRPDQPVPFGGRQAEINALNAWLNDRSAPPYCLLAAEAGRGKSALLVRWLDSVIKRGAARVIFFPISIRFNTSLEEVTFAALASRLGEVYGEPLKFTSLSAQQWREVCLAYLNRTPPDSVPVLVVLDGLDEASDWRAGPDLFPLAPQPGIRVLVSARYLAGDVNEGGWLKRLHWESSVLARSLPLPALTREGVSDVLAAMGKPLDQLATQVDVYEQLFRLSQGDPLLVRLYVDALLPYGSRAASIRPEALPSIQEGLAGYFDSWWDDQQKQWQSQGRDPLAEKADVLDFLNIAATARGPISRDDVAAIGRGNLASGLRIRAIATDLARFVIGDGQARGYVFGHPRLSQYFWDQMTDTERTRWEVRFIEYGDEVVEALASAAMPPSKAPAYVLRYYGAHMERAQCAPDKHWKLIQKAWMEASYALEGTFAGFLNDVDRTWRVTQGQGLTPGARGPSGAALALQVRCALCSSSVTSLSANIPAHLLSLALTARVLTPQQALVLARQIPDDRKCADALVAIAPDLPAWQLDDVLAAAQRFASETTKAWALGELAPLLPPALRSLALASARSLKDPQARALAVSRLAPHLETEIRDDVLRELLDEIARIEDEQVRTRALKYLASNLPAQSDLLSETRAVAATIQTSSQRVRILIALAARARSAEKDELLKGAREAVESIQETNLKLRMLAELAALVEGAAKEDLLLEVLRLAWGITDEQRLADLLALIVADLPADLLHLATQLAMGRTGQLIWLGVGVERVRKLLVYAFAPPWLASLSDARLAAFLDRLSQRFDPNQLPDARTLARAVRATLDEVLGAEGGRKVPALMVNNLARALRQERQWHNWYSGTVSVPGGYLRSTLEEICAPAWIREALTPILYVFARNLTAGHVVAPDVDSADFAGSPFALNVFWNLRELSPDLGQVEAALTAALGEVLGGEVGGVPTAMLAPKLAQRSMALGFDGYDVRPMLLRLLCEEFAPAWIGQLPEKHLAAFIDRLITEARLDVEQTDAEIAVEERLGGAEGAGDAPGNSLSLLQEAMTPGLEDLLVSESDPELDATRRTILERLSEEQAHALATDLVRLIDAFRRQYYSWWVGRTDYVRRVLVDASQPAWIRRRPEETPKLFMLSLLKRVGTRINGADLVRRQEEIWSALHDVVGEELNRVSSPELKARLATALGDLLVALPETSPSGVFRPLALALLLSHLSPGEREDVCQEAWAALGSSSNDARWLFVWAVRDLPEQIVEEAARMASQNDDPFIRLRILVHLIPRLGPDNRQVQVTDLLRDVRKLAGFAEQVEVLIDLASWQDELLTAEERAAILQQALETAKTIGDRRQLIQVLAGLARESPSSEQPDPWTSVLAEIARLPGPQDQCESLVALAPTLSEAAAANAFEMARGIGEALGPVAYLDLLLGLTSRLPDAMKPVAAEVILAQVKSRAEALRRHPAVLPAAATQPEAPSAGESGDSRSSGKEGALRDALGVATVFVPLALTPQVLDISSQLLPVSEHVRILARILQRMPEPADQEIIGQISEAIRTLMPVILEPDLLAKILDGQVPERQQDLVRRLKALVDAGALEPRQRIPSLANLVRYMQEPEKSTCLVEVLAGMNLLHPEHASRLYGPLARHLSEELLRDACSKAMSISEDRPRAQALSSLLTYLPPDLKDAAVSELVRVLMRIDAQSATELLKSVSPYLSEPSRTSCIQRILTASGERKGREKAEILSDLLPNLPAACEDEAIALALSILPLERKAIMLGTLGARLAGDRRASVLEQALSCLDEIREATTLPDTLVALMRNAPDPAWQDRILAKADALPDIRLRIKSLTSLAPHFADRTKLAEVLARLYNAAKGAPEKKKRAELLLQLAPHLPPFGGLMPDALAALLKLPASQRWQGLAGLAPRLAQWATAQPEPAYEIWQWTLREISKHTRPEFLREMNSLLPFTRALVKSDEKKRAVLGMLDGFQEVCGWWP